MKSRVLRLSHTLRPDDARFPGNPDVRVSPAHSFENGDCFNTFEISFFNHNGTHIDFPNHFVRDGRKLGDYEAREFLFDRVFVVDLPSRPGEALGIERLSRFSTEIARAEAILIRTGHQALRQTAEYPRGPYIGRELAHWLREFQSLKCIGLDTLSITSLAAQDKDEGGDVHRILLGGHSAPFVIEDMDLAPLAAPQRIFRITRITRLTVAPWFIEGVDGGPCTVFAETEAEIDP